MSIKINLVILVSCFVCHVLAAPHINVHLPSTTNKPHIESIELQRYKRGSNYGNGYQPYQEWSDRIQEEAAKNPPTAEERADAENTAKKAGIGLLAGMAGGLITGGLPGMAMGGLIGTASGAFSDKIYDKVVNQALPAIADNLMNKTLPAIYKHYREPAWEMP